MPLYRFTITPKSAWGTPMRSDTLTGLLLYRLAEDEGEQALQTELKAFNAGEPPFVLSSAMPVDTVFAPKLPPIPRQVFAEQAQKGTFIDAQSRKPLSLFEALQKHKVFRKKRFLPLAVWQQNQAKLSTLALFTAFCREPGLWPEKKPHTSALTKHVTINRHSGTALDGALFSTSADWHRKGARYHIYAQTNDPRQLLNRLERIGFLGFGRDSSTGKGLFSIEMDASFQDTDTLTASTGTASLPHSLLLSVFSKPILTNLFGYYATEVKTGKAGPVFSQGNPFKKPFICVNEGAVLTSLPDGPFVLPGLNANSSILQITYPLLLPCKLADDVEPSDA